MADAVDAFLAIPDLFGVERPVRQKVVKALAEAVDESFGDDAADLAQTLRESGAVDTLARLLDDQVPGISNRAMMVLGNLVGEFFDPEACQSLDLLLQAGGMERVEVALHALDADGGVASTESALVGSMAGNLNIGVPVW